MDEDEKPTAIITAINVASINLIPPVIVSPPNISLRELVSIIPGMSSITSPMLIISTESASPALTAIIAINPPNSDDTTIGINLFTSSFLANSSIYLKIMAINAETAASFTLPPKKMVKVKAISMKNKI